jgi:hypothetical protein
MPNNNPDLSNALQLRHRALSSWDNEGGAPSGGHQEGVLSSGAQAEVPPLRNAELVQLRIRVIALENLVISLLAQSSDRQLDLVRENDSLHLSATGIHSSSFDDLCGVRDDPSA